jgi:hypothetical protein
VLLKLEQLLIIEDHVEGSDSAPHRIEWFWHPGQPGELDGASLSIGARSRLVWSETLASSLTEGGEFGWRSEVLGVKEPAPVLRLEYTGQLPIRRIALLDCGTPTADGTLIEEPGGVLYGALRIDLETGTMRRS